MKWSVAELQARGLLEELTRSFFNERLAASVMLEVVSGPGEQAQGHMPPFTTAASYWLEVAKLLEVGLVHRGIEKLLASAARVLPGNTTFAQFAQASRQETAEPPERSIDQVAHRPPGQNRRRIAITLDLPEDVSEVHLTIRPERQVVESFGGSVHYDLVTKGSTKLHLFLDLPENANLEETLGAIQEAIPGSRAYREEYNFRDYLLDPLFAEGPDGARFELQEIRASTRVSDVATQVMGEYESGEYWPKGKADEKPYTVDARSSGGQTRRLRSQDTLHDAGVRPRDTLHVYPERRAGAVNSLLRAESLTIVRNQILDFARGKPWFVVEANSLDIPTEYVFRFQAPSFSPGEPPRRIDEHGVLLVMPPDFPVQAPRAFWQNDIFHPNIHFETGLVCLGVLQDSYTPGLDFGVVCQMLVDMAGFRNYELSEGYNKEAAHWAASDEGQKAIAEIGGRSIGELQGRVDRPPRRVTLRKVRA